MLWQIPASFPTSAVLVRDDIFPVRYKDIVLFHYADWLIRDPDHGLIIKTLHNYQ